MSQHRKSSTLQKWGQCGQDDEWKSKAMCFNCGKKGHVVDGCNKEVGEDYIAQNKKKFIDAKKKGKTSNIKAGNTKRNSSNKGIWTLPSAHEASFGSKCLIMGDIRIYDAKTKKWNIEKTTLTMEQPPPAVNANRTGAAYCPNPYCNSHAVAGVHSAGLDLDQEQEALINMHVAQFKSNMRAMFKTLS